MFKINLKKDNNNILRNKMNEKLENEIMFSNYRMTVLKILDADRVKTPYLPLDEWLHVFDAPNITDEFTDGQKSVIADIKIELNTLANQLGYNPLN